MDSAASRWDLVRDTRIRFPPAWANFWDIERPMPREAPVIKINFLERGLVIVVFVGEGWSFMLMAFT